TRLVASAADPARRRRTVGRLKPYIVGTAEVRMEHDPASIRRPVEPLVLRRRGTDDALGGCRWFTQISAHYTEILGDVRISQVVDDTTPGSVRESDHAIIPTPR